MDTLTVNSGQLMEIALLTTTVVHVIGKPGCVITAHSPAVTPTATLNLIHILMVMMNMLTASSGLPMEIVTGRNLTVEPVTGRNGWLHIAKHLAHNLTTYLI